MRKERPQHMTAKEFEELVLKQFDETIAHTKEVTALFARNNIDGRELNADSDRKNLSQGSDPERLR